MLTAVALFPAWGRRRLELGNLDPEVPLTVLHNWLIPSLCLQRGSVRSTYRKGEGFVLLLCFLFIYYRGGGQKTTVWSQLSAVTFLSTPQGLSSITTLAQQAPSPTKSLHCPPSISIIVCVCRLMALVQLVISFPEDYLSIVAPVGFLPAHPHSKAKQYIQNHLEWGGGVSSNKNKNKN